MGSVYNTQDPFFLFIALPEINASSSVVQNMNSWNCYKNEKKLQEKEETPMKKKAVSLLIAGLMMLGSCTMAGAADFSDTEVVEQSVESAGDSVETEAMEETPEEAGDIAESETQDTEVSGEESFDEEELSLDESAEAAADAGTSIQKSGRLSNTITWDFYDNGELVINGTGV